MKNETRDFKQLPEMARKFIDLVIRKMGYRRKIRNEVRQELTDHFIDALRECSDEKDRQQLTQSLIESFGDPKLLGKLIRRGKKRCRPLWKKVIIRSLQAAAALIGLMILYTVWFLNGTPTIRTDYLAQWNQMARPTVPESDNAWPHYEKAAKLFDGENSWGGPNGLNKKLGQIILNPDNPSDQFSQLTREEQTEIQNWIERNEPAWQEYIAGSQKSFCWRKYNYGDTEERSLLSILLPNLTELRDLSRQGVWRARLAAHENKISEALNDCLIVIRVGRHFQHQRTTCIEQLVGIGISTLGHREIARLAALDSITPVELSKTQHELSQIYVSGFPTMDIQGEKLMFLDTVQHVFTDGGPGGGHIIPQDFRSLNDRKEQDIFLMLMDSGPLHAGRNKTVAVAMDMYNRIEQNIKLTPWQIHSQNCSVDQWVNHLSFVRFGLIRVMMPALERAGELMFQNKAEHQATLTLLALRRWRLEKGSYPESLNELVQNKYIDRLPADPYSDGPLKYARCDDDFILYSVGRNFADDEGMVSGNDTWGGLGKNKAGQEEQTFGDRVFWPIQN